MTRVSASMRVQVLQRADFRCEYCRRPLRYGISRFHVDHIVPVERHLGSEDFGTLRVRVLTAMRIKAATLPHMMPTL